MTRWLPILVFLFVMAGCKTTKTSNESDFYQQDDSVNLYAFVGKKISIKEFSLENSESTEIDSLTGDTITYLNVVVDYAFNARYRVLKNVHNELPSDTIDFVVFDHYGPPRFKKYNHVLLYLSLDKEEGVYYHQKYIFDPLKKVDKNQWRGLKNESLEELFNARKNDVFRKRGLFN